ncbi:MAG: ribosomal large chain pseudouridine synthase [Chlamydiales bacterium]|jgi:23S rRNA pseudouridine2605 synthase|nr:ribosomal large chain pseudouridine synthase [Chlamydiales bacterium]
MTKKRLSKVLAAAGVASRRQAEEIIFAGRVSVNGEIADKPQMLVDIETDSILVDKKEIEAEQGKLYFLLNKPRGCVCTSKRDERTRIVLDIFKGVDERLFTVGRLDRDTEGLLIVTNDGHFANQVIHPSSNIEKEYLVKTLQEIGDLHLKAISKGALVEDRFVAPCKVEKVRKGTLKIVVKEGKKREVRILVENAGLKVLELTRIRIGKLLLGVLPTGKYRPLTERERELIFE